MKTRPQTAAEETVNAITHVIGSHLSAAVITLLIWNAVESGVDVPWKVVSGAIFGACALLLYVASSAYHIVTRLSVKRVLEKFDHIAIYFLIAGSYTPFCLVSLRPGHAGLAWTIFGLEWGAVVAGVVFKIFTTGKYKIVSTLAYIVMGWAALIAIVPLIRTLAGLGTMWLAIGGGLYTLGAGFYIWSRFPFFHAIWHVFVLCGTICHGLCILWYVML